MFMPTLAHDNLYALSGNYIAQALILSCWVVPAASYLLAALLWRKRRHWRHRLWAVTCYYAALILALSSALYSYVHQYHLVNYLIPATALWTLASPLVGFLLLLPPRRPRPASTPKFAERSSVNR
jgi:hypothetical protein